MPIPAYNPSTLDSDCAVNYGSIRRVRYCLASAVESISGGTVSLKAGESFRDLPILENSARLTIANELTEQGPLNTPGLECVIRSTREATMNWLFEWNALPMCVLTIDGNDTATVLFPVLLSWRSDSEESPENPAFVRVNFVPSRNLLDRYNSYFSTVPPPPVVVPPVVAGDFNFEFDVDFD